VLQRPLEAHGHGDPRREQGGFPPPQLRRVAAESCGPISSWRPGPVDAVSERMYTLAGWVQYTSRRRSSDISLPVPAET
jgi:hypothetical protein